MIKQRGAVISMKQINLNIAPQKFLRNVDPRMMSYNVEMTEVTGGTFWMAYTPGSCTFVLV
jgi:hypothetical protein